MFILNYFGGIELTIESNRGKRAFSLAPQGLGEYRTTVCFPYVLVMIKGLARNEMSNKI